MYGDKLLTAFNLGESKLNQASATETQPVPGEQPASSETGVGLSDVFMVGIPLAFVLGWGVVFFIASKTWTVARQELTSNFKRIPSTPCRNCQYFTGNPYLKCAVNPSIALTEQATECSDYIAEDEKMLR